MRIGANRTSAANILCDENLYGITQQYQLAVEKMFGTLEDLQFRPRLEFVYPGNSFLDIDQFIAVAL